ncbi:hypothetical protein [Enterovibrio norvegicus]|uniref:hypothetical protein n=1 Tax=Enterovibrio norvegicus TaxID=188144 RepID=UPI00352BDEA6
MSSGVTIDLSSRDNFLLIGEPANVVYQVESKGVFMPTHLKQRIEELGHQLVLALPHKGKIVLFPLSPGNEPTFQDMISNISPDWWHRGVYVTDDPLFAALSWTMDKMCFLISPSHLSEALFQKKKHELGNLRWFKLLNSKYTPKCLQSIPSLKVETEDWYRSRAPQAYKRIIEVYFDGKGN